LSLVLTTPVSGSPGSTFSGSSIVSTASFSSTSSSTIAAYIRQLIVSKITKNTTQILLKLFLYKQSIIPTFVVLKSLDFNKRSLSVFQAHPCSIRE
jgi:hypothetical protein